MVDAVAGDGRGLPVAIVQACLREGRGGSPTAVVVGTAPPDEECRAVPARTGTSHAVFVSVEDGGPDGPDVSLRFFTAAGELPACGHGTLAALALLAEHAGGGEYRATVRTAAGVFAGRAVRAGGALTASFDIGAVEVRGPAAAGEHDAVLDALGLAPGGLAGGVRVASTGRPRLLVPVPARSVLAALAPDADRLRAACDRLGLLGCYVHSVPTAGGRLAARMFAPSIGVPEDIANANSTACLAAHLARTGLPGITVDMGDALGAPAAVTAAVRGNAPGSPVRVGGAAAVARTVRLR
ncbi:PhzF family phenazine biosynthesis isomerase [Kitasatospora sp. NPDC051914]|uniref:PhzF family phenazine biosynthesis protein n=1 Tax=Kitasatospora sp. NPDC051914 TaxID=3154945 RepID=UPI00341D2748